MGGTLQGQHTKMAYCMFYRKFLCFYCAYLPKTEINAKFYVLKIKNRPLVRRFIWYILF